ncbi:MAG TPA: tetratricopeptide repeat protein [Gemmataceae bacterium]|nr:tetratricopeptide repeat protein [Gemmataceae bacterium]
MSPLPDPNQTVDDIPRQDSLADDAGSPYRAVPASAGLLLREEIARGGMGAVLRGRDVDFGRDVAVKVLREDHQDRTELQSRFLEEARIAGRLQHPGVAPVYALGRLSDGRPYFTMKLVEGRTLAALLADRPDASADRPRLVAVFEQVCQTVAYAHSRGIIHRDLKPLNIMVGGFGEVQVMDWGLAKELPRGGGPDEPVGIRSATGDGSETRAGSVLGTPAYMAPEQARGEVEKVDERSDVFGLGAILCEILTGKPPFIGPRPLERAQQADLAEALARLDGCGADAELIALAKRCLSASPSDRPRDAGETASAVTAYRQSVERRLHEAALAQAAEAARAKEARATAAQERKARRLTVGLAVSVVTLLSVGAGAWLWMQRQWSEQAARTALLRQSAEMALDKAQELEKQDRWPEARAVLEPMRGQLNGAGLEDVRRRVEQAAADAALVERLEGIRLKRSSIVEGQFDDRGADEAYAAAFHDVGLVQEGDDSAAAAWIRASAVGEQLTAALDDWAATTRDPARRAWLLEAARRADPDPWRDRFRDPAVWSDRTRLEALELELLHDQRRLAGQTPPLLATLGYSLLNAKADAAPLLAAAQSSRPDDFWLNFALGDALCHAKKWDEAAGFYRAAVALRPSAAAIHNNLGVALYSKGRWSEAIQEYRYALEIDPKQAAAHTNLGNALQAKGQLDEAIEEQQRALEIDPKLATAHFNLGLALYARGRFDEAIQAYRTALEIDPNGSEAHNSLGAALYAKGRSDEAIPEYYRALEIDSKNAQAHFNLGNALKDKDRLDEAIPEYRRALEIDSNFAQAHSNLGAALYQKDELTEAIQELQRAVEIDPKLSLCHANLGGALLRLGRFAEARESTRRCLELLPLDDPVRREIAGQLQRCDQFLALDHKLAAVVDGKETPADDVQRINLARLCQQPYQKRYAASARLFADAFAHDAKLAEDMQKQDRYNAACAAALAGCGKGADADKLDDQERARLRKQAVDWLRADLVFWTKLLASDKPGVREGVQQVLKHWQEDPDLSGQRDAAELAKLPADEQEACKKLWADVQALLDKAEPKR